MDGKDSPSGSYLRLPADLYVRSQKFSIDNEIRLLSQPSARGIPLADRWEKLGFDAAISFGRRTLEIGFLAYAGPHHELLRPKWAEEWKAGVDSSISARNALRDLLLFMAPADPKMELTRHLEIPLYSFSMEESKDATAREVIAKAQAQAETLHEAYRIIANLVEHMERRRRVVSDLAQNAGDPAKRKFVTVLARAWLFLTGRTPGSNPSREKNPFVRFTEAAWTDLGGIPTSFDRAVRALDIDRLRAEEFEGRVPPF